MAVYVMIFFRICFSLCSVLNTWSILNILSLSWQMASRETSHLQWEELNRCLFIRGPRTVWLCLWPFIFWWVKCLWSFSHELWLLSVGSHFFCVRWGLWSHVSVYVRIQGYFSLAWWMCSPICVAWLGGVRKGYESTRPLYSTRRY